MRAPARKPGTEGARGFTLVELLVTMGVAGLLTAALYQFFVAHQRSHTLQEEVADAQQSARVALEELTRSLSSLGTGTQLERGQVRFLVAQPYQLVFNADLDADQPVPKRALPPGAAVPGAAAGDPYRVIPPGINAASWPAETYRYTLDRNCDNVVTGADWEEGRHYTLSREINGGSNEEVASLVANPSVGEALFAYWGDFDGDGSVERLNWVTAATSPRVASGEPLDAVIRRVEVSLVAETPNPTAAGTRRRVRLSASVSPENLWDCPLLTSLAAPGPLPLPALRGGATALRFRVTRGGVPEPDRTVAFEGRDPNGGPLRVTDGAGATRSTTGPDGVVTAFVLWPPGCDELHLGTYAVRAWTQEPPTLSTAFGTCSTHEARVSIQVIPGPPERVHFGDLLPGGALVARNLELESCGGPGGSATVDFTFLDACDRPVPRVDDNQARLEVQPDSTFLGRLTPAALSRPAGTVTYDSPAGDYGRFRVPRDPVVRTSYAARLRAVDSATGRPMGETGIRVKQVPTALAAVTRRLGATAFTDCPDPALPVAETFAVQDECGNPIPTLSGSAASVSAALIAQPLIGRPTPSQGAIASPGNRSTFAADPITVVENDGIDAEFSVQYQAPTCTVGGFTVHPQLTLRPSWPGAGGQTLPISLGPCGGCSVQLFDATGAAATHLNRSCDARSDLVVTQCLPVGTTAEVVIGRVAGAGMLSLARNSAAERATAAFVQGRAGQTAQLSLFIGTARTGDAFRVGAFIPDQAAVQAGNGVLCQSEVLTVDTSCSEILISAVPDNPQAPPAHQSAAATPLCGADGTPVFFRVKDCDQNERDDAPDDLTNAAGRQQGLLIELLDRNGRVIDREGSDLREVDVHGRRATDSPYFQGALTLTVDPSDGEFSGRLRVSDDHVTTLRARYLDPDDPADGSCLAEALVIPPLPLCFAQPMAAGGDWAGPLRVHWGDTVVEGDLVLPNPPELIDKDAAAILDATPYGPQPSDRFFDAYVGGVISVNATRLTPSRQPDQPFLAGGVGQAFSPAHGNYIQAVPDIGSLLSRVDYSALKTLAQARRVYWVPEAGGRLFNPATFQRGAFEEVTRLPHPGAVTPTHDGTFLFVDAPPALQSGALLRQAPLARFPSYEISGAWYTEGFIYVAGSVVFHSSAGAQVVGTQAPDTLDARYDENRGTLTRADLPLDYAPPVAGAAAGSLAVNLNGALYCEGEVEVPDGFRIYGSLTGGRGGRAAGTAEVWYDPRWQGTRRGLCSRCCSLSISPSAARVSLADTLPLAAPGARGSLTWETLSPQVATVDPGGLVRPVAVGRVTIRAVDGGGCRAQAEVEVF